MPVKMEFHFFHLINTNWYYVMYRYTLGGFFLANYEDSPAGIFDEVLLLLFVFCTFYYLFHDKPM